MGGGGGAAGDVLDKVGTEKVEEEREESCDALEARLGGGMAGVRGVGGTKVPGSSGFGGVFGWDKSED